MQIGEILEQIDKGNLEVIQKLPEGKFREILQDTIKAKVEPIQIKQKYSKIFVDARGNDNYESQLSLSDQKASHIYLSLATYLSSLISSGDVLETDTFEIFIDKLQPEDCLDLLDKFAIAMFYDKLFHYNWYKGNDHKAIQYGNIAKTMYCSMEMNRFEKTLRANILQINQKYIPVDDTIKEYTELLEYFTVDEHTYLRLGFEISYCSFLLQKGELQKAYQRITEMESILDSNRILKMSKELQSRIDRIRSGFLEMKANYCLLKGNFNNAKKFFHKSKDVFLKTFDDKLGLILIYSNLGYIEYLQSDYKLSTIYYNKAIKICNGIGNNELKLRVLFRKYLTLIDQQNNISKRIQLPRPNGGDINKEEYDILNKYLEAYQLFVSDDIPTKLKSLLLFESLIDMHLPFYLELNTRLNITKLLLIELTIAKTPKKLRTFNENFEYIKRLSETEGFYYVDTELVVIKTSFFVIHMNFDKAFQTLNNYKMSLEDLGHSHLIDKIVKFSSLLKSYIDPDTQTSINDIFRFLLMKFNETLNSSLDFDSDYHSRLMQSEDLMKVILHPDRFKVMNLLYQNLYLTMNEVSEITKIPMSSLSRHVKTLTKHRCLITELKIIDTRPEKIMRISTRGINHLFSIKKSIA